MVSVEVVTVTLQTEVIHITALKNFSFFIFFSEKSGKKLSGKEGSVSVSSIVETSIFHPGFS